VFPVLEVAGFMAGGEEMDLDFSSWGAVPSFGFAFNSEIFSDRVLQLEVVTCEDVAGESLPDSTRSPKEKGAYKPIVPCPLPHLPVGWI
jgi:hypothetical protein